MNKAIIFGYITKDPELKTLPSGIPVCSFTVATNRVWKDKDGNKQESAEFHNVVSFRQQATAIAQCMKKGSQILVEGRIQTRSWDKEDGTKAYRTEIIAENARFGAKPQVEQSKEKELELFDQKDEPVIDPETGNDCSEIPFN